MQLPDIYFMSKLFLLLFAIFCGGMLSANTPELVINPDAENWQKVLTEHLKRYPQTDTLRLLLNYKKIVLLFIVFWAVSCYIIVHSFKKYDEVCDEFAGTSF